MEMKMDGRLLALSLLIFIFLAVLESSAQNFYPLRYGKRDNRAEGRLLRGARSEQGNDLFYGSSYGKRSPSAMPSGSTRSSHLPMTPAGYGTPEISDRYERSPDSRDKFYIGSRFGKRDGYRSGREEEEQILCRHTGVRDLYHCLEQVF